jgi:hypothetical protein
MWCDGVCAGRASSVEDGGVISFGTEALYGGQYSLAPAVSRLSDTSFVIAYFDNTDDNDTPVVMVRHGTVDAKTLTITLGSEVVFADNSAYKLAFSLVGLSSDRFMLAYYNGLDTTPDEVEYGPLQTIVGRVDTATGTITLGQDASQIATLPNNAAFKVAAARVSDTAAVVVFGEVESNYGVTAVLASALQEHTGDAVTEVASLGSVLRLTSGGSFAAIQQGVRMDLDVQAVGALSAGEVLGGTANSPAVKFAVLYSDFANSAKQTISMGMVKLFIFFLLL